MARRETSRRYKGREVGGVGRGWAPVPPRLPLLNHRPGRPRRPRALLGFRERRTVRPRARGGLAVHLGLAVAVALTHLGTARFPAVATEVCRGPPSAAGAPA